MKIAHLTDLHFDRKNADAALASLDVFIETCRTEKVDAVVSSGDLFNAGVQNSERDRFPELLDRIETLLEVASVFAVTGTPTHDLPGAYEPLTRLNARYQFHLLDPSTHFVRLQDGYWARVRNEDRALADDALMVIMGVPEPSKSWFLSGQNGIGKDDAREAIETGMRQILLGCGAVRKQYPSTPAAFVYHGSVRGASMANGQTVPQGEIAIGRDDLAMVGADYYALGHIHLAQQIGDLPAYYGGSAYPVNWSETQQTGFNLVTFEEVA